MATTYPVVLKGGPCAGQVKQLTAAQIRTETTTCGGATYSGTPTVFDSRGRQVFAYQAPSTGPAGTGGNQNVSGAWTRWMHGLGRTGPESHRRIQRATARARRIGR